MECSEMDNSEDKMNNDESGADISTGESMTAREVNHQNLRLPKKRGRKKKSEQVVSNALPISAPNEKDLSTSRKARKRKSVDYFALENPDFNDVLTYKVQKIQVESGVRETDKLEVTKTFKKRSGRKSDNLKKENVIIETESVNKCPSVILNQKESIETTSSATDATILQSVGLKRGSITKEENIQNNSCSLEEDQPFQRHVRKGKVYRKTGSTVDMMNTLLSKADFKNDISATENAISKSPFKRGRPKRKVKVENADSDSEEFSSADQKSVTCAVCNKDMEKNSWIHHKQRYHNNLAWRVGEPALDLDNMNLVKQILNALYAAKKLFYCDKCDKSVKSVHGFLSHKSVCGKATDQVKVSCQFCNRKMLPISLPAHIRYTHENKDKEELVPIETSPLSSGGKRQAAEKALRVIHNFNLEGSGINATFAKYFEDLPFITSEEATAMLENQIQTSSRVECKYPDCNFECFSTKDIKNHLKFCVKKPENGYVCKHCLLVQLNIADMIYHIENVHDIVIEDEKQSDRDSNSLKNAKNNKKQKINSLEKEKVQKKWPPFLLPSDRNIDVIYRNAFEWTLKFCESNYTTIIPEDRFPCLKSDWDYMDLTSVEEYLPKMPYSCSVGFETVVDFQSVLHKDHTFRTFELFESYLENNGNSTIFCGGPITALAWMPTPFNKVGIHQIVAVATKPHPDAQYSTDVNYNEKCFLQFWDVGPLKNTETSLFRPRQAFCLKFDNGPIWDLQWCPSNCYDLSDQPEGTEKLRRMGVIAVAASDSFVYIYSIPNFKESGQFYNARPTLKLIRNAIEEEKLGNMDYYATRMSWTKASGHKYLAVGYSNGQVAMYNLWSDSELLRYKTSDNLDVLMPYTVFEAHHHSITAMSLHHSHDGCQWLMTGSYDRTVRTWDLEQNHPVRTIKGNIVSDAIWMTNWMCHIIGYDEASTIGNACSVIHQCKEGFSDPLYLFHCSSAITSLSSSDWLNGIIQANSVGEIFATFPKQLMMNLNLKNMKNKKLLFGYTTLVEKDKTVEERLKVNSEKENALRNQLKVKTKIKTEELPSDRDVMHLDYNPHYYEYEPLVYHEMDDKYGLIFCDHKMKTWSDFPPQLQKHMSHTSERYTPSRPNMYPLQAITRIQFNMNRQASVYYVSGYQAGFLRLTHMNFLKKDPYVVGDGDKMKE